MPGSTPPLESTDAGLRMIMDKAEGNLLTSGRVVADPALQDYANDIVCRLAPEYCGDIRVYVVRQPGFNATMAPNGFMSIWTGLLLRASNEAQLATVIGHELAHYIRQHTLQRWETTKSTLNATLVIGMATAMAGVGLAGDLAQIGALGYLSGYSRDQEREADSRGFTMMTNAGYPPQEASKIWSGIVAEREAAEEEDQNNFLATHPPSEERFQILSEMAAEAKGQSVELAAPIDRFVEFVLPHRGEWLEDELDLGRFARVELLLDRLKGGNAGFGVIWYYQGELHRRRGEDGDQAAAITAYRTAQAYDDAPAALYRGLGLAHWSNGDPAAARAAFERYLVEAPEADDFKMIRYYLDDLESMT